MSAVTIWYRAGRRGQLSGSVVEPSLFSIDDFEHVQITSQLIVAQAYAYGADCVVYRVQPADEVVLIDAETGHGICEVATIDGTAPVEDVPREELWASVARCVWWDGSRMYNDDGTTAPPPGLPESAGLHQQFQSRKHLLPREIKMLLENHAPISWDWPQNTWLIG